ARDEPRERLELLVIEEIDLSRTDRRKVEGVGDRERVRLLPRAILVVAALRGDLADVDLGVEVRREGVTVLARVAVEDVDRLDRVEVVLERVHAEDARHAGIESAAGEGEDPALAEAVVTRPLLVVGEARPIRRLVVRRVEVMDARLEAGLREREVLIGERDV